MTSGSWLVVIVDRVVRVELKGKEEKREMLRVDSQEALDLKPDVRLERGKTRDEREAELASFGYSRPNLTGGEGHPVGPMGHRGFLGDGVTRRLRGSLVLRSIDTVGRGGDTIRMFSCS